MILAQIDTWENKIIILSLLFRKKIVIKYVIYPIKKNTSKYTFSWTYVSNIVNNI